jgi:hypothetical protein
MENKALRQESYEPEIYCLVCQKMEWDEENRRCANFNGPDCPLAIRQVLADFEQNCVVL